MADVEEKPKEIANEGGDRDAGDAKRDGSKVDDEYKTLDQARKDEADKLNPKKQLERLFSETQEGSTKALWEGTGKNYAEIAKNPEVQKKLQEAKVKDPSAKLEVTANGEVLSFAPNNGEKIDLGKEAKKENVPVAESVKVGEGSSKPGADKTKAPSDNVVRPFDPQKDTIDGVMKTFDQVSANLPPDVREQKRKELQEDLQKSAERLGPESEAFKSMLRTQNVLGDRSNLLGNDQNRLNAMLGLAARGADPSNANRQGANPFCALISESRIEQQNNFQKYADETASLAMKGGCFRGGENGTPRQWVDINKKEYNGANFAAGPESGQLYNRDFHQKGGKLDYLGQLDAAKIGQETTMANNKANGLNQEFIAANAHLVDGAKSLGQASPGGALLERGSDGKLQQVMDKESDGRLVAAKAPPTTLDNVARVNYANGGGGLMVHENMARDFMVNGKLPEGMTAFKDAADLKAKLAANPGKEYQIATNGTMVASGGEGKGHGLHAQSVKVDDKGNLVFGNNWSDKHNNKTYSDEFVNAFTDPKKWDGYQPSYTNPDGSPDWRREKAGPKTDKVDNNTDTQQKDRDAQKKKEDEEKEREKAKQKEKEKKEQEEAEKKKQDAKIKAEQDAKIKAEQSAQEKHKEDLANWRAKQEAAKAKGIDFSEPEPTLKIADT
ncbi:MAG: hypothetical protein K2X27_19475 [Candidatus Obscuribacterales bacterium]|nr:hypothetical protein [Candidatus Obscuribacterales bacterium]